MPCFSSASSRLAPRQSLEEWHPVEPDGQRPDDGSGELFTFFRPSWAESGTGGSQRATVGGQSGDQTSAIPNPSNLVGYVLFARRVPAGAPTGRGASRRCSGGFKAMVIGPEGTRCGFLSVETAGSQGADPRQAIQRHVCSEACVSLVGYIGTLAIQPPFQCNLPYAEATSDSRPAGGFTALRLSFKFQQQPSATLEPSGRMKSTERARDGAGPASRPDLRPTRCCVRCSGGTGWRPAGTGNNFRALRVGVPGQRYASCAMYVPLPLVRGREPPQMVSRQPHFDDRTMRVAG